MKQFFQNLPENIGLTFFVIQHHSSKHVSLLDRILARETSLHVKVVEDGMVTEPNHLYIIPPGHLVSIYHGNIYFIEDRMNDFKLPIDHFFESLAIDQGEKVIGIIMSGTGKDGTVGMQKIQEYGGTLIIQSDKTSQFYDMPQNTAKNTSVDYILSPKNMPSKILEIIEKKKLSFKDGGFISNEHFSVELMKICHIIRLCSGIDFSHYKEEMIARRVKIRMSLLNIQDNNDYINILNKSLEERINLFDSLTVGSKKFFQDEDICDVIEEKILPIINYSKKKLRIWSVGCSTGQEVYSLTILILEYLAKNNISLKLKVFATDIDESALNSAREGIYKKEELHQIDERIINKYFKNLDNGFRVLKEVREMIVFAKHDLLKDPPFSNLDLINCRNVLMNYNKKAQYNILYTFHYALNADGFLIIGRRESLGKMNNGFSPIDGQLKIFSYKDSELSNMNNRLTSLKSYTLESQRNKIKRDEKEVLYNNQRLIHKLLEKQFDSGVLIDSSYKIIQIFNDVHSYLRIAKGRFSDSFFANISSDLALIISNSLKDLENKEVNVIENEVREMNEKDDFLLKINKISFEGDIFYLITFNSIDKSRGECRRVVTDFSKVKFNDILEERISFLEKELQASQKKVIHNEKNEENQILDLEKSNHHLILSNEKLQTINEELYSINDEYEIALKEQFKTSKELKILLKSLPVEAVYLDKELKIISMSDGISKYTHLIEKDMGRSIEHLVINKNYPSLSINLKKVLKTSKRVDHIVENEKSQLMFRIEKYPYEETTGLIIIIVNIDDLLKNLN